MSKTPRLRLSYANVTATLALFFALGAGGYAIGAIPNKEGTISACYATKGATKGQLRAVDGTARCRKGERKLKWNQRGPAGLPGQTGATGAQGPIGPAGISRVDMNGIGSYLQTPEELKPGSYLVTANVQLNNTTNATVDVTCTLTLGKDAAPERRARDIANVTVPAGSKQRLTLTQIHQFNTAGPAGVDCQGLSNWNGLIYFVHVGLVSEI